MSAFPGHIAFDEYGKPFIILRDQQSQKRLTGNDAIKVSISIARLCVLYIHGENHFFFNKLQRINGRMAICVGQTVFFGLKRLFQLISVSFIEFPAN